eukprot:CFRG4887T1
MARSKSNRVVPVNNGLAAPVPLPTQSNSHLVPAKSKSGKRAKVPRKFLTEQQLAEARQKDALRKRIAREKLKATLTPEQMERRRQAESLRKKIARAKAKGEEISQPAPPPVVVPLSPNSLRKQKDALRKRLSRAKLKQSLTAEQEAEMFRREAARKREYRAKKLQEGIATAGILNLSKVGSGTSTTSTPAATKPKRPRDLLSEEQRAELRKKDAARKRAERSRKKADSLKDVQLPVFDNRQQEIEDVQSNGDRERNKRKTAVPSPGVQSHSQQLHSQQIHRQQVHSRQIHNQQVHGQQLHSQQLHSQQVHDQQIHSQQVHSQQLYNAQHLSLTHAPTVQATPTIPSQPHYSTYQYQYQQQAHVHDPYNWQSQGHIQNPDPYQQYYGQQPPTGYGYPTQTQRQVQQQLQGQGQPRGQTQESGYLGPGRFIPTVNAK